MVIKLMNLEQLKSPARDMHKSELAKTLVEMAKMITRPLGTEDMPLLGESHVPEDGPTSMHI